MTRPIRRREGEPSRTGHRLVRPGRSVASSTPETITVTLAENMGYSTSQQASATVDADPGTAYIAAGLAESEEITVHDPQNRFLWALDGAKGKAAKATNADTGVSEWVLVECETKANHIVVTLNEDAGETDSDVSYSATVQDFWEGQDPGSPQHVWDTNSEFAGALSGDTLHARWDEIDGKYRLISEAASAQHEIWFTANNDMVAGTSAAATVDRYIGNDPGGTVDVLDPDGAAGRWKYVLAGSVGHAVRHADGEYYITYSTVQAKHIRFAMTQDMQAGSPKRATSTTVSALDGVSPGNVTVYDYAGLYDDALDTATGFAILDEGTGHYNIITCDQKAFIGRANVNEGSDVAWNTAQFNVDGIDVAGPPDHSQTPTFTQVENLFGWPCDDDQEVFWFREGSTYYAIPKPPLQQIDVPTDLRYDSTLHKFEWKLTQNVLVWQADDQDAAWDTDGWHTCVTDKFVIDSEVTAGNDYNHKETTVYCMEAPVDDETFDNTWVTGSEC